MQKKIQLSVLPSQFGNRELLMKMAADEAGVDISVFSGFRLERKSVDARVRPVRFTLSLTVWWDEPEPAPELSVFQWDRVDNQPVVLIAGAGPAGYFAALRLIELGYKPVIIERGKEVSLRKKDVALLSRNAGLNPESNYCFGEGGAGTFSDGKLYTRSKKKGDYKRILEIFHLHGAAPEILYESHPHIGTDKLPEIIKSMRKTILDCGGEIHFESRLSELIITDGSFRGLRTAGGEVFQAKALILATGHSAGDVYEMMFRQGLLLEAKPFAMGVRVKHPQELIDEIQYHGDLSPDLPVASYALAEQIDHRGVYSFCMCPGGFIVPSSTMPDQTVVNGMSSSGRNTPFANSGIVVEIRLGDMGTDPANPLSGLKIQRDLEHLAFLNGGEGQVAPAQRLDDFVKGRLSGQLPPCSYIPGVVSSPVHFWLPSFIADRLRSGFLRFDQKMRGFLTAEALVTGVESRSSSPVRIPRDPETLQHVQVKGLFPCGEGSGYAGGITSSAVDGENCAAQAALYLSATQTGS